MRVLHVTADYGLGGVETFLGALAEYRGACASMEPEFLMFKDGYLKGALTALNATVHDLGEVRLRWPRRVLEARRAFRYILTQRKFDVVVFHQYPWMPLILDGIRKAAGCRCVRWFHSQISEYYRSERALKALRPRFPDLSIYNSGFLRQATAHDGFSEVLYYGVAPRNVRLSALERAGVRLQCATPDGAVVVIQVSRMAGCKGHREHLQALALLRDEPDWMCWFAGGAQNEAQQEYLSSLKRLASDLGIAGRVRFLGNRTDVPRLLGAADIFCQPNVPPPEAFGISLVEALYAGLPVVTSSMGGPVEIVDEATGITVPPGDVPKLAVALKRLLQEHGLRRQISESGPRRARELCDPATQVVKLGATLQRLTPSHG
jgi:glycosyltransferase involved in cell wall biosynthesis